MIMEFLIDCVYGLLDKFFATAPDMTWSVDTGAWQYAKDFLDMIAYLLPMSHVYKIIEVIIAVTLVRIFIQKIRTLLDILPFT